MNKKSLSERDICSKFINPSIEKSGWNMRDQVREEVSFTDGKVIVQGQLHTRGKRKRADYILYYKPSQPLAIIEAKDNNHNVGDGMQQALEYAEILDIPFVFTSNGDSFMFHDKTVSDGIIERELSLEEFPSPESLWEKYLSYKNADSPDIKKVIEQDYFQDDSGMSPRYYQQIAINRTVEAIAKGQNRLLLVMATGTGKTYTAFNIIWRLWKSQTKKRILFLADRNALLTQTKNGDLILIMGGPMGVKDIGSDRYPWLKLERDFIKKELENERPIIGVCLGAQLLASAAGGDVEILKYGSPPKALPEIGWSQIFIDKSNKDFKALLEDLFMFCIGMEIGFYYLIKQYSSLVVHVVRNSFLGLVILLTDYNSI